MYSYTVSQEVDHPTDGDNFVKNLTDLQIF